MKEEKVALPTFEEFEESSLLDAIVTDEPDKDKDDPKPDPDPDPEPDPKPDPDPEPDPDPDPEPDPEPVNKKDDADPDPDKDKEPDPDKDKDKGDGAADPDPGTDAESFWTDVEKITGRVIEDINYGDVDPETAEGAAIREEALVQQSINDHLDYLAKIYPKEFRALEHAAHGGSIDELYTPGEPDYSRIELTEEDVDGQKSFMKNYYIKKGFNERRATRMVETDEDSEEGLFKAAGEALKELATGQEKELAGKMETQKRQAATQKQEDLQMIGVVEQVVTEGKLNKFTVPVKEKESFYEFALSHMQRNPQGGYMFVTPVDPRQLESELQNMYFRFKRGDLSTIIQREVKTEGAKKLKRTIAKGKKTEKKVGGADDDKNRSEDRKNLPTMDDYNA